MDDSIRAIRQCDGGESVENGHTKTACDYCEAGRCRQMEACEAPRTEADMRRDEWRKARIAAIQTPFD